MKFLRITYYEERTQLDEQAIILSLNKLLVAVKTSKSRIVLEGFSEIYAVSVHNTKSLDVEDALLLYIKQIDSNCQLKSLEMLFELSLSKNTLGGYREATDIFAFLLKNCNRIVFEDFTKRYVSSVIDIIQKPTKQFIERIVAFILLEILFFRIDFQKFESTCREIVQLCLHKETDSAQELIKLIAQRAVLAVKEEISDCPEMFRLYQCQCYKALVSVISNTKRDVKHYSLLFAREAAWNVLVDAEKHYSFEPTFDNALPTYKNQFVSIRNEVRALKRSRGMYTASVNYSESQSLFNSTLSEDVSKFDFTNTMLRKTEESVDAEDQQEIIQQDVPLETIEINNHECMATICGLIEYMVESDISPLPEREQEVAEPPEWMLGILKVLNSETTQRNAKLLLAKVIHNTKDVFKPYAKRFLPCVAKLICEGCFGDGINYFIYDLVSVHTDFY